MLSIKQNILNQLTVNGVIGRTGHHAQLIVEEEPSLGPGHALILLQLMVVQNVRELLRKGKNATQTLAPVRGKACAEFPSSMIENVCFALLINYPAKMLSIKQHIFNQLTVHIVIGRAGQNALLIVEEERRRESGAATVLLQLMVVQNVREMLKKRKNATHTLAPVRGKACAELLSSMIENAYFSY